ncbi:MAG: hypothetical protein JXA68_04635, partial [Ignavibacteriales bacterium]|nr:hypothetical protein [Ignavibacteriales bacterium]
MKSRKLFWGAFFITLGGLWLLGKLDAFNTTWSFIWKIWPFILILWGVAVLTKNTPFRQYISAAFGFLLALLIYGSIANLTGLVKINLNDNCGKVRYYYYENLDSTLTYSNLEINGGLSMIVIKDTTAKLVNGRAYGSFGEYDFDRYYSDSMVSVVFDHNVHHFSPFKGDFGNRLDIELNKKIKWNLQLNIGVSKSYLDLREFCIGEVELNT